MIHRYFTIANLLLITAGVYLCVSAFYTFVTARLDHGISSDATAGFAVTSLEMPWSSRAVTNV